MTAKPNRVQATFDGQPIESEPGASVAAALVDSDRIAWRTTRRGRPRGLFCGIGVCFDCIVEINGESGQRACMITLEEGMRVCAATPVSGEPNPTAESNTSADPNTTAEPNVTAEEATE